MLLKIIIRKNVIANSKERNNIKELPGILNRRS